MSTCVYDIQFAQHAYLINLNTTKQGY